jgi:hypothetical protein
VKRISRRDVLIATALGFPAAVIVTLLQLSKEDASNVAPGETDREGISPPPTRGPDSAGSRLVRSGSVVSVEGDAITIENSDGERVRLLTADYLVDDGFWVSTLPIEIGDRVHASAGRLYVNPKFYYGPVLELIDAGPKLPRRFRIQDRYDLSPYHEQQPEGHVVLIDPRTLVAGPLPDPLPSVTPYRVPKDSAANREPAIEVGQHVEVVGRAHRGELYAIRIML